MLRPFCVCKCVSHKTPKKKTNSCVPNSRWYFSISVISNVCTVYRGAFHIDRLSRTRSFTLDLKYPYSYTLGYYCGLAQRQQCFCTYEMSSSLLNSLEISLCTIPAEPLKFNSVFHHFDLPMILKPGGFFMNVCVSA